ncbi:MAG: chromosomal replication initiation ATPase DnaA [Rickettsiales bacterium]|jgi:chromosomal replication initiation ATPase DnaA
MTQLSFNFDVNGQNIDDELTICHSNLKIFHFLDQYRFKDDALPNIACLIGGKNSGKTSFINLWRLNFNAKDVSNVLVSELNNIIDQGMFYYLDDVCKGVGQEFLFHLINIIKEKEAFLLFSSSKKLADLSWSLEDVKSRIKNIHQLEIENPDDDLVKILLTKYFSKRQLKINSKIIDYISSNIKRDFDDIFRVANLIEESCFARSRKITIPFLKKVLNI